MIDAIDAFLGERIERTIRSHHHRRLDRIGWAHALEALPGTWASADRPPREGNEVELLVDGASALPAIAEARCSSCSPAARASVTDSTRSSVRCTATTRSSCSSTASWPSSAAST